MFNCRDTDKPHEVIYSKVYKNGNRIRHREDCPATIGLFLDSIILSYNKH